MLQDLCMDVEKVDRDVAYVAMAIHVCCKRLFQMFHLFFQMYVAYVFIWLLHMFHTYVANVLSRCCICFAMACQVCGVTHGLSPSLEHARRGRGFPAVIRVGYLA